MTKKKVSRRSFLKRTIGTLLTFFGAGYGGYFYANQIEPRSLEVNSLTIEHSDIPKSFDGLRILQFSDTHLGFHYDLNQFKELMLKINQLKPDIILFTGDLMDAPNEYPFADDIIPHLKNLSAPFGKYAIYGNHDHGGYGSKIYRSIMELSDFDLLLNQSRQVKMVDNSSISLIGIDDAMLGKPNYREALKNVPNHHYKILLSHAPDLADDSVELGVQLQLSGHSHGGQIKLPFIGALITPPFAKKYHEGIYEISHLEKQLTLYVNRGIGTTRMPFRFLSKPELTIFTLKSM
ncbi:metallophosphoesterase [Pseudoneobacillus sp. C159]